MRACVCAFVVACAYGCVCLCVSVFLFAANYLCMSEAAITSM